MTTAILERSRHDAGSGYRYECGFLGPEEYDDGMRRMCPEIPVAVITETCACGHVELLPACQGHAEEAEKEFASDDFIVGHADSPGLLTCPQCRYEDETPHACVIRCMLTWDDMRPVTVIQDRT